MMKKLFTLLSLLSFPFLGFSQTPEIGHFQQLKTVRRGDTLDVAWYYKPAAGTDVRSFQVDWQYKKRLFTHISTTVDVAVSGNGPEISYRSWEDYKYQSYSSGNYTYVSDTNWTIARNYLVLSNGSQVSSNGYIIHNKYIINNVIPNFVSDTVTLNWARMFKVDGTTIGDNVAILNYNKLAVKLLGNLTISGKVWLPPSVVTRGWVPTLYCYENATGNLVSTTVPDINTGLYVLDNIDENTRYKIELRFNPDSLVSIRDNSVTVTDAVKAFNEFVNADISQTYPRTYLQNGLAYLIADINWNQKFDGGDPYGIYASVSGLRPIATNNLIKVFTKNEFDSLALGINQWSDWTTYNSRQNFVLDTVLTSNLSLDLKYYIQGDVDRSHSSPVYDANGNLVRGPVYTGRYSVNIPNSYSVGQPMFVPFNVSTNGLVNYGLQFEMKYDPTKVRFAEIISKVPNEWLQYVTHDDQNGIIRFGGMNNQKKGGIIGLSTPFNLKFTPIDPSEDISSYVFVRQLMDASNSEGEHFNIELASERIVLTYRAAGPILAVTKPIAEIRPNPNSGQFELTVTFPNNYWMKGYVYDYNGRKVLDLGDFKTDEFTNVITRAINAKNLAQGKYLLVMANNNERITKPFVKI
jgi:hypothetical protein